MRNDVRSSVLDTTSFYCLDKRSWDMGCPRLGKPLNPTCDRQVEGAEAHSTKAQVEELASHVTTGNSYYVA